MNLFLDFLFDIFIQIFNLLNSLQFRLYGYTVYYGWFLVFLSVLYIVVSALWRGSQR